LAAVPRFINATANILRVDPVLLAIVPENEPVDPSNAIAGYPPIPFDDHTVLPAFPIDVPLFPFPDLSFHAVTVVVPVTVEASAASNHS
jgi:hypothetical protein